MPEYTIYDPLAQAYGALLRGPKAARSTVCSVAVKARDRGFRSGVGPRRKDTKDCQP
jgi:hypothetical protein